MEHAIWRSRPKAIVNGVPLYRVKWEQEKKVNQKQYTLKALKHAAIKRGVVNRGIDEQLITSCNQNVEIIKVFKPKKISKLISKQTDSSPVVVSCTDNDDNSNEYWRIKLMMQLNITTMDVFKI